MEIKQGISLNDLIELSKKDTQYKKLFTGLAMIDQTMRSLSKDIISDIITDDEKAKEYYIKTEIMNKCYSLYIFNSIQQVTIGVSWPLADFLTLCSTKSLEFELQLKIKRIISKFNDKGLSTGNRINWLI